MNFPSEEELQRLSLRALVAYAVRWSQRVRPALSASDSTVTEEQGRAVDEAIAAAAAFVEGRGVPATPEEAMPMAHRAKELALAAVTAVDPNAGSQFRYAARTAGNAAETLAQALTAFAPACPAEADDILEPEDPLALKIYGAALMAHSAAYSARFVLREAGVKATAADDYATLLEQHVGEDDPIGTPFAIADLGSLWSGAEPEWPG